MQEKENSISLQDIFHVLWKNIILLGIITVAVTVLGIIYTFGIAKPTYSSQSSIIVAVSEQSQDSTDVDYTNSLRAVVTVADTIKDNKILDSVAKEYNLTSDSLAKMVSVSNSTNSMKIVITVEASNSDLCEKLAEAIAQKCVDEAVDGGVFFFAKDSIVISSDAQKGTYASPNKKLYVIVSVVIGLVLGCVVIFVKEFMSTKYKTRNEIENSFEEKVIGVFPDDKKKDPKKADSKDVVLIDPSIRSFEPYNKLLSNIKYANLENPNKVIVFTSTVTNELKSTTAANLAYCMANNHHRVIILDLDLRKSVLHKTFGVERENGIVEYVAGDIEKDTLIKHSASGVDVITAGKDVINPVAVLETTKLKDLISNLKNEYDYVVIDTAPSLACSDCQIIASYSDGIIFSIALNQAKKKDIMETVKSLKNVDAKIIGISITKAEAKKNDYYYYYTK